LEAHRLAGRHYPRVDVEPVLLVFRHERAHALADRIDETGLLLERAIDLEKPIVDGTTRRVENHLDDTEPLVDRVDQRAVLPLARTERLAREAAARDIVKVH